MNKIVNISGTDIQELLKEIVSINNNTHLESINESNVKTFLDRHTKTGYIIVSACRGYLDFGLDISKPQNINKLNQINNQRTKYLLDDIKKMGFTYTPCFGGFIENIGLENEQQVYEKSFIVYPYKKDKTYNFAELKNFAIDMCIKYNQDSVLIKSPTEPPKCYLQSGEIETEFSGDTTFNDITQTYFTDLHKNTKTKIKNNTKPTRFSFTECYIPIRPQCYSERYLRDIGGERFIGC